MSCTSLEVLKVLIGVKRLNVLIILIFLKAQNRGGLIVLIQEKRGKRSRVGRARTHHGILRKRYSECPVLYGADVGVMELTVSVLGEQAELAAVMLVFVIVSCPVTSTQLPMGGYDAGKFCSA